MTFNDFHNIIKNKIQNFGYKAYSFYEDVLIKNDLIKYNKFIFPDGSHPNFDMMTCFTKYAMDIVEQEICNNIMVFGTFDLFHYGHLELLRKCKELANKNSGKLVVGISSDEWAKESGKNLIIDEKQRYEIVKSIKYVDDAYINNKPCEERIDDIIKYNIGTIVIDEAHIKRYKCYEKTCQILSLPRTDGISSTKIKEKIKNE